MIESYVEEAFTNHSPILLAVLSKLRDQTATTEPRPFSWQPFVK